MKGRIMVAMKKMRIAAVVAAVLLAAGSCGNQVIYIGGGDEAEEIFVNFQEQPDGSYLFFTNKRQMIGYSGHSYWKLGTHNAASDDDYEYTLTVHKRTGSSSGGAGMVFAASDPANFLVLMVNNQREYLIGKKKEGESFKTLTGGWLYSELLHGAASSNALRIEHDSGEGIFNVFFNGSKCTDFYDTDPEPFIGGFFGYMVELKSDEDFPLVPVDVSYTQVFPSSIGMQ